MDSKIILAVLIVALIGIVAATYHNEANDAITSLSNVATESNTEDSVTDDLESGISGDNSANTLTVDESTVKPDNTVSTTKKLQSNSKTSTSKSNSKVSNKGKINNKNSNDNKNNSQNTTAIIKYKVTRNQAAKIAITETIENHHNYTSYTVTNPTSNYKCYIVKFFKNNKQIGYYEVNPDTGEIEGGAFEGEVNP